MSTFLNGYDDNFEMNYKCYEEPQPQIKRKATQPTYFWWFLFQWSEIAGRSNKNADCKQHRPRQTTLFEFALFAGTRVRIVLNHVVVLHRKTCFRYHGLIDNRMSDGMFIT